MSSLGFTFFCCHGELCNFDTRAQLVILPKTTGLNNNNTDANLLVVDLTLFNSSTSNNPTFDQHHLLESNVQNVTAETINASSLMTTAIIDDKPNLAVLIKGLHNN